MSSTQYTMIATGGFILAFSNDTVVNRILIVIERSGILGEAAIRTIFHHATNLAWDGIRSRPVRLVITNTSQAAAMTGAAIAGVWRHTGQPVLMSAATQWMRIMTLPTHIRMMFFGLRYPEAEFQDVTHILPISRVAISGQPTRNSFIIAKSHTPVSAVGIADEGTVAGNNHGQDDIKKLDYEMEHDGEMECSDEMGRGDGMKHGSKIELGSQTEVFCQGIKDNGEQCKRRRKIKLGSGDIYLCCEKHRMQWERRVDIQI